MNSSPYNSFELDGIEYVCFDSGETAYKVVDAKKIVLMGDKKCISDNLDILWDIPQARSFMEQFSRNLTFFIEMEYAKYEEKTKTKLTDLEKALGMMSVGALIEGKALHKTIISFLKNNESDIVRRIINFIQII